MSLCNPRYYVAICIILISGFVSSLQAQSSSNPFDIIHTGTSDASRTIDTVKAIPESTNRFDIISSDIEEDTTSVVSNQKTKTSVTDTEDSIALEEPISADPAFTSDNPFDISRTNSRKSSKKSSSVTKAPKENTTRLVAEKNKHDISIPSFATKKPINNKYLLLPLLLCLGTLAFVLHFNSNILKNALNSFTNNNVLMLQQRLENNGFTLQYILLYIVFIVQAGINLSLILQRFSLPFKHISFIATLLAVLLIYLTRHIFLYIVGREYNLKKESDQYSFTIVTYNILFGIFLIPINLLIIFGPESLANVSLYLSAALFVLLLIIRILRSLLASVPLISSNLFQFFMYLCTFEIFPLIILYKVVFP